MKILHCIHSLQGGGAERQLKILSRACSNYPVEFAIFCIDDAGRDQINDSVKIFKISSLDKYPVKTVFEISEVIKYWEPDIVQSWLPPSITVPTMLAAKLAKKRCITAFRNRMHFDAWLRIPDYICQLLLSNQVISNNPVQQSAWQYRFLFNTKNGIVIPNAVEVPTEYYKKYSQRKQSGVFKVLFVGRLTQQKNWQTLFKALSLIKDNDWELLVCGDGNQRKQAEEFINTQNLESNIKLLGYQKDVYRIMSEAHLLVLPSLYEGMPNVVLESMATGLPCVISDNHAHKSLVGQTGAARLFSVCDHEQLSNIIRELKEDRSMLDELSKAGYELSKKYSADNMMNSYYNVYAEILN